MAGLAADPSCLSLSVLNDGAKALRASGRVADSASVVGGRRSKARFVTSVLRQHAADAMIVGHIGQSPVAWILKKLGRVRAYAVVLHGNEAWKRLSFFQRLACRDAFCVIATTQFTARRFVECNAVPRALLRIAPLCADESSTPASNLVLTGDFRILIVGRQMEIRAIQGFQSIDRCGGADACFRAACHSACGWRGRRSAVAAQTGRRTWRDFARSFSWSHC